MINQAASAKRVAKDCLKLSSAGFQVKQLQGVKSTIEVSFKGPADTPYQTGVWKVLVYFPPEYPFKSPSVGFKNKIYHPNIDWASGSVCLDVINQTWSPMYQLSNIFQAFLPQLLTYPNTQSPLNREASQLYSQSVQTFNRRVQELVQKHAMSEQSKKRKIQKEQSLEQAYQRNISDQQDCFDSQIKAIY